MTFFKTGLRTALFGALVAVTFTASAKAETFNFEAAGKIGDTVGTQSDGRTFFDIGGYRIFKNSVDSLFKLVDNGNGKAALGVTGSLTISKIGLLPFKFISASVGFAGVENSVRFNTNGPSGRANYGPVTADDSGPIESFFPNYDPAKSESILTAQISAREVATSNGGLIVLSSFSVTNPVPGPIAGAGLPALLVAVGGFAAWRRRKAAIAA